MPQALASRRAALGEAWATGQLPSQADLREALAARAPACRSVPDACSSSHSVPSARTLSKTRFQ
eukprot:7063502-Lingulodinium_polyedra.AAC.1